MKIRQAKKIEENYRLWYWYLSVRMSYRCRTIGTAGNVLARHDRGKKRNSKRWER